MAIPPGYSTTAIGFQNGGALDSEVTNAGALSFTIGSSYAPFSAGLYTNASDENFKSDIQPVTNGLATTLLLKPSTFVVKQSGIPGIGFIAQDVQPILPELVSTDKDGMLGVAYVGIIPILTHAIQELSASLDGLRAEFQAYKESHP
jgi:hypothetical protein